MNVFNKTNLLKFNAINIFEYRIVLLDVAEIFMNTGAHDKYVHSLENALRDKEWLLLPAVSIPLNLNASELSAIMDGNCFSSLTKYATNDFDNQNTFFS